MHRKTLIVASCALLLGVAIVGVLDSIREQRRAAKPIVIVHEDHTLTLVPTSHLWQGKIVMTLPKTSNIPSDSNIKK